jgi:hypothetical protein
MVVSIWESLRSTAALSRSARPISISFSLYMDDQREERQLLLERKEEKGDGDDTYMRTFPTSRSMVAATASLPTRFRWLSFVFSRLYVR